MTTTEHSKIFQFALVLAALLPAACAGEVDGARKSTVDSQAAALEIDQLFAQQTPIRLHADALSRPGTVTFAHKLAHGALQVEMEWHDRAHLQALVERGGIDVTLDPATLKSLSGMVGESADLTPVAMAELGRRLVNPTDRTICGARKLVGFATARTPDGDDEVAVGLAWSPDGVIAYTENCPLAGWDDRCDPSVTCEYSINIGPWGGTYNGCCAGLLMCSCGPLYCGSGGGSGGSGGSGGGGGGEGSGGGDDWGGGGGGGSGGSGGGSGGW